MLVDLANRRMVAGPGVYKLTVLVRADWQKVVESSPVTIELRAPSATDAREAERLRSLTNAPHSEILGWAYLITRYWETPIPSPALSADAREQVALHLFLHRAFFGPEAPAQLDMSRLNAITAPHLQAEVAALKLELAVARRDQSAPALRQNLLTRWPGMRHRVDTIDAGRGLITEFRQLGGAEGPFATRVGKLPYTP
jgi:hypothetical protein